MLMHLNNEIRCRLSNHVVAIITFQCLLNFHATPIGAFEDEISLRSSRKPMGFTSNQKHGCLKMKYLMGINYEHEGEN